MPRDAELTARLPFVLAVVYLVFNEGYTASAGDALIRPELCAEAIRLARLLADLMPDEPEVLGLLALLLLTEARRPARTATDGSLVRLADQDRGRWDRALIAEGQDLVRACLRRNQPGPYQLQAAISAVHADAPAGRRTDWRQILALYDQLAAVAPTPVVALNRCVAVAEVHGPAAALGLLDQLDLDGYHLFHATRADLLRRPAGPADAADAYDAALARDGQRRGACLPHPPARRAGRAPASPSPPESLRAIGPKYYGQAGEFRRRAERDVGRHLAGHSRACAVADRRGAMAAARRAVRRPGRPRRARPGPAVSGPGRHAGLAPCAGRRRPGHWPGFGSPPWWPAPPCWLPRSRRPARRPPWPVRPAAGLGGRGTAVIAAAELACFAVAALLVRLRRPGWSVAPLSGVVLAEGLRAHPEGMIPVAGALLTYCHLLPAVLWASMLVYTARTAIAWRAGPAAARGLFRLYGTAAAWLFGIVVVTVLSAVLLVPVSSLLTTTYGRFLVAKAALVAAAAALALASRAGLRRPAPPRDRAPLRGPAGDRRARRRTGRNRAAHRADIPREASLLIGSPPGRPPKRAAFPQMCGKRGRYHRGTVEGQPNYRSQGRGHTVPQTRKIQGPGGQYEGSSTSDEPDDSSQNFACHCEPSLREFDPGLRFDAIPAVRR